MRSICFFVLSLLYVLQGYAYDYEISICALFQNESRFLKEWLDYHKKIGVEHFWLYNNFSEDDFLKIIQPYMKEGIIELIDWPYRNENVTQFCELQCNCFNDCLKRAKGKSRWVAFIDIDEFLIPVKSALKKTLSKFKHYSGIGVNWQMYGTSHVWDCEGSMLTRLLRKAPTDHPTNLHVKSIVQPKRTLKFTNPHYAVYTKGYQVTENKVPFKGPYSPTVSVNKLRINHYWSRDDKFLYEEKIPRLKRWWSKSESTVLKENEEYMQEYDDIMLKKI